eukprot:TRINITY_DN1484_c0_g2_i5.p2 TRINITY_DN1484_c0_g2~~TRINITY_DN1484_c0_g2_i5.p2  ORF type:complete len:174 (+),score=0.48 TRINITY_DN1484_c0_g2_i5:171-692(+)
MYKINFFGVDQLNIQLFKVVQGKTLHIHCSLVEQSLKHCPRKRFDFTKTWSMDFFQIGKKKSCIFHLQQQQYLVLKITKYQKQLEKCKKRMGLYYLCSNNQNQQTNNIICLFAIIQYQISAYYTFCNFQNLTPEIKLLQQVAQTCNNRQSDNLQQLYNKFTELVPIINIQQNY